MDVLTELVRPASESPAIVTMIVTGSPLRLDYFGFGPGSCDKWIGEDIGCRVDRQYAGQQQPTQSFADHVAFLYARGANPGGHPTSRYYGEAPARRV